MQRLLAPWMAWWLALAVVLAPALGRMHEVLHAPLLPERHAPQAVPHAHQHAHQHAHGVAAWFGEHTQAECLVLDQLGHGAASPAPLVLASQSLPAHPPAWTSTAHLLPAPRTVFLARAPPAGPLA
ncbi:hypothetical protein N7340_10140 [Comamonas aquatica]|uniref:hypothetical protein n=1 Tax=Comamonas aquatica TaxID=225991 RepID=UPI00244AA3EF|nr:hypothetical protein [Comamonas aquatica]MDH0372132.1 hypothetical protein [Comamonas aquatica]